MRHCELACPTMKQKNSCSTSQCSQAGSVCSTAETTKKKDQRVIKRQTLVISNRLDRPKTHSLLLSCQGELHTCFLPLYGDHHPATLCHPVHPVGILETVLFTNAPVSHSTSQGYKRVKLDRLTVNFSTVPGSCMWRNTRSASQ